MGPGLLRTPVTAGVQRSLFALWPSYLLISQLFLLTCNGSVASGFSLLAPRFIAPIRCGEVGKLVVVLLL